MLDVHAHAMQVKLCKANTQGVTQATMGTHTEPLEASPMNEMPEPANATITTVKDKQSSTLAHEAADRPSPPNQVEGPDTACDATGAHIEPPKASPTIAEPDATTVGIS